MHAIQQLFRAVEYGNIEAVRSALAIGADVGGKDKGGETPLHRVVQFEKADVAKLIRADLAKLLIDHGADVNARCDKGSTPLFHAAWRGRADVSRILIEHGATVDVKDINGRTAADLARKGVDINAILAMVEAERLAGEFGIIVANPAASAVAI